MILVCERHGVITDPIKESELVGCIQRHMLAGCSAHVFIRRSPPTPTSKVTS